MPISGTFEANGRTWTFRKPYVGPVLRFNDTLALAEEGKANMADILRGALDIIQSAVGRMNPGVTRDELADCLDNDDILAFKSAIVALSGKEEGSGEG